MNADISDEEMRALMLDIPNFRIEQLTETRHLDGGVEQQRSKYIIRAAGKDYDWPDPFVADFYINDMLDDRNSLFLHPPSRVARGQSLVKFISNAPAVVRKLLSDNARLERELSHFSQAIKCE